VWKQPETGLHESAVQRSLSLHDVAVVSTWTQPEAGLHESAVQRLASSQMTADPPMHVPPPQASPVVQAFPSSQATALSVWKQPEAGLQPSSVHTLLSLHVAVVSVWTQPEAGLHESEVQRLLSSQARADAPLHVPPPHESPVVQASPSSQAAALFVWKQPEAGVQPSSVQTLPSSQFKVPAPG